MNPFEKAVFVAAIGALVGLSLWLQFGIIDEPRVAVEEEIAHDPDYYIDNFTATGMDDQGHRKYVLEAERLVHYPDDDTALLDKPHVIQYEPEQAPRHTYADSGWVSADGDEVLLTGNVRVIQGQGGDGAGGITTTDKLRILLKQKSR